MKERWYESIIFRIGVNFAVCTFFLTQVYLHFNQTLQTGGVFLSDFPDHLELWTQDPGYSLTGLVMGSLYHHWGATGVAIAVSLFQLASILILERGLQRFAPSVPRAITRLISFMSHIAVAVYIPKSGGWYLGTITGAIYHNMTYIAMAPFALLAFFEFLKLLESIRSKISLASWARCAIWLTIATAFKPSFVFAFAPALLIVLIMDFFQSRMKNIKNDVALGSLVFPSVAISLFQSGQLFNNESHIVFMPFAVFAVRGTWLTFARSFIFIAVTIIIFRKQFINEAHNRFSLIVFGVSLFQSFFLAETGPRFVHGNLTWGAFICYTIVFSMAAILAAEAYFGTEKKQRRLALLCGVFFGWHVLSGCVYLLYQLNGAGYGILT